MVHSSIHMLHRSVLKCYHSGKALDSYQSHFMCASCKVFRNCHKAESLNNTTQCNKQCLCVHVLMRLYIHVHTLCTLSPTTTYTQFTITTLPNAWVTEHIPPGKKKQKNNNNNNNNKCGYQFGPGSCLFDHLGLPTRSGLAISMYYHSGI